MKFTRELPGTLTVRSVGLDGIRINEETWTSSIALTAREVLPDWPAKPVDELTIHDFERLLQLSVDLVLLGTGDQNRFPPRELVFSFARKGIGLETMETRAAARTFNVLAGEGRPLGAVLLLEKDL